VGNNIKKMFWNKWPKCLTRVWIFLINVYNKQTSEKYNLTHKNNTLFYMLRFKEQWYYLMITKMFYIFPRFLYIYNTHRDKTNIFISLPTTIVDKKPKWPGKILIAVLRSTNMPPIIVMKNCEKNTKNNHRETI